MLHVRLHQPRQQRIGVLHNICEVHKEQFDETWMEELASGVNASSPTQNTSTNTNAESIRTALCNYMNS